MTRWILVDGKPNAAVHALDRGLQFGDGVFETMRVADGQIPLLPRHLERLLHGCSRLAIAAPDADELNSELVSAAHKLSHGVIKLIVTRGSGSRGYAPPANPVARRILIASDCPDVPLQVRLTVSETRLATGGNLAGIKHLNRLEQVVAAGELQRHQHADEGLMMDSEGHVIEATSANVFVVRAGQLTTPSVERCGVAGIMRQLILELAQESGIACTIDELSLGAVLGADEVFLSNSVTGIRPVVQLEDREWSPGPITQRLIDQLETK